MSKKNNILVVICVFNNEKIIGKLLESIKSQTLKNFKCVVVDDNSTDKTVDLIERKYPFVKVIKQKKNCGPSLNRNVAINWKKTKYVITLDSDVILDKNWVKYAYEHMEKNNDVGIMSCKLLYPSGRIFSVGGEFNIFGLGYHTRKISRNKEKGIDSYILENQFWVSSAALIFRRKIFEKIGFFDSGLFYGYDDTDLGWKCNLLGYKVVTNLHGVALHFVNETVQKMKNMVVYHSYKNRIRLYLKYWSFFYLLIFLPLIFFSTFAISLLKLRVVLFVKGISWNIVNLSDTLKERKKIQKYRQMKDQSILKLMSFNFLESFRQGRGSNSGKIDRE